MSRLICGSDRLAGLPGSSAMSDTSEAASGDVRDEDEQRDETGGVADTEPVKLNETSGGWIYLTGLLGLDGGAGLVDPHLGWQGRG
jgi:hypothetical protein